MVSHAAFSPICKFLVTCDMFGNELIVTDVAAGKHLHTLPVPDTLGNQFAISPDGRTLASACQPITDTDTRFDEHIHLWDLATGRKLHSLAASSDGTVASLTFLDEQTLASGMDRGTALIWDVSDIRALLPVGRALEIATHK